jgi:hypothetical protein
MIRRLKSMTLETGLTGVMSYQVRMKKTMMRMRRKKREGCIVAMRKKNSQKRVRVRVVVIKK